jgi:hypothetical protein
MSAVVDPKCGHASHLIGEENIDIIDGAPQVHLHFLTDDLEYSYIGFSKVEICCHGCGESVLVYYDTPGKDDTRHIELRDSFTMKHKHCPDRNYEERCPNFRTRIEVVDLRDVPSRRRGFRGSRTARKGTGSVPTPRPEVVGNGRRPVRKEAPKG